MESDSDGDDYETLATLAVAIASFAKRKHNLSSKTRTVAAWEVVMKEMDTGSDEDDDAPRVKLTRRVLPRPEYSTSAWAEMLRCPDLHDHESTEAAIFRRRFRIPHAFFLQLVKVVKDRNWYAVSTCDAVGRPSIPVELKVRRESPLTSSNALCVVVSLVTAVLHL